MRRQHHGSSLGRWLGISLLVHLVVLLLWPSSPRPRHSKPVRLQVALRSHGESPRRPLRPPHGRPLPPAPKNGHDGITGLPSSRGRDAHQAPLTAEVERGGGHNEMPAPPEEGRAIEPGSVAEDASDGVDLFPRDVLLRHGRKGDLPLRGLSDEERIALRVERWAADGKARDRVRAGLVDPYFARLGERLRKAFEPGWDSLDPALADASIVSALGRWGKDWLATAGRYGEKGSPYFEGETPTGLGDELPQPYTGGDPTLVQLDTMHTVWRDWAAGRIGGTELDALVRVVQSPEGRLLEVEVVRSSGKPRYDEMAKEAVRRALERPLKPKRSGTGLGLQGDEIVSLWKFRTRFTVVPPATALPAAGGGIAVSGMLGVDENGNVKYPLAPVITPHVELVAVF